MVILGRLYAARDRSTRVARRDSRGVGIFCASNGPLVILHTRKSLVPQVIERTDEEHPYDMPQILVLSVIDANPDYRSWVLDSTSGVPRRSS
jgi:hypothetical protein